MSDRAFGVEFEFRLPELDCINTRSQRMRFLADYLRKKGINIAPNVNNGDISCEWRIIEDGSEFEVKTPVLCGPSGFEEMRYFLDTVNEMGAECIEEYDGTHVHFDAPDFVGSERLTNCLIQSWYENQEEIMKLVHSCRLNRLSCPMVTEEEVITGRGNSYYRSNLNLRSLRKHGTVEFRAHEGTLNYEEISSWINFGQCFLDAVSNQFPIILKHTSIEGLMTRINVERNAARFLTLKKQRNYAQL